MDMNLLFGQMEPSAQRLIESAQVLKQAGVALDSSHIMLAALQDADKRLVPGLDDQTRAGCIGALQVQLQLHAEPNTKVDAVTARLRQCALRWNDEALHRSVRLNDALMLWAITCTDDLIGQILHALRVDRDVLARQLEGRFEYIERVSTDMPVPFALNEHQATAYNEATNFIRIVRPSTGSHFAQMHAVLMSNVFNVVGKCDLAHFAVLGGRNGSPIESVAQVIADRLATGERFSEARHRLQGKHGVFLLNLVGVSGLAQVDSPASPHEVLRMAMLRAREENALLVIDDMQILKHHGPIEESLLAELANPGETLILGLYKMVERGEHGIEAALKRPNIDSIIAHEYGAELTKETIQEFYLPLWELRAGYTFTPDAFDGAIALEPGAWINQRRKTLPYLAIGLGDDTIETARGGAALIKSTAVMALDALKALKDEWATCDEHTRRHFEGVLESAWQEIARLRDDPLPAKDEHGYSVLTRAHVSAQLICPNDSEFHYPGHAPKDLIGRRHDDLPLQEH
jgi:hypothetical protein